MEGDLNLFQMEDDNNYFLQMEDDLIFFKPSFHGGPHFVKMEDECNILEKDNLNIFIKGRWSNILLIEDDIKFFASSLS